MSSLGEELDEVAEVRRAKVRLTRSQRTRRHRAKQMKPKLTLVTVCHRTKTARRLGRPVVVYVHDSQSEDGGLEDSQPG